MAIFRRYLTLRDIEGPSKDGGCRSELDRSSREGERAFRYVKGRTKYRANWHDSHTSVGLSRVRERAQGSARGSARIRSQAYIITSPDTYARHYILRYAYACVIASIVHESAWFMSSYEGRSRCAWAPRRDDFSCCDDAPRIYSHFRPVIHREKPRMSFLMTLPTRIIRIRYMWHTITFAFLHYIVIALVGYSYDFIIDVRNNWIIKY